MLAQPHVHDLTILINGAEGVPPTAANLEQGLVCPPLPSERVPVPTCGLDEPWREGMNPIVDRARVDGDAPLSQPLRDIGVAEAETQVPTPQPARSPHPGNGSR